MDHHNILLLDSQSARNEGLNAFSKQFGFTLYHCLSEATAEAYAAENSIDMLLFNAAMIPPDDLSFFCRLKAHSPHLYSLVFLDRSEIASAETYIQKGVDNYLLSPAQPDMLLAILRQGAEIIRLRKSKARLAQQRFYFRQYYENLLDHSGDGIVVINKDYTIRYANAAFRRFLNCYPRNLSGQRLYNYIEDGYKVLHYIFHQLNSGKKISGYPIRLAGAAQSTIDVNLSAARLEKNEERPDGSVLVIENRTFRNELFNQLIRKEKLSIIQHLTYTLAHEIHNPANILSGRLQLLQNDLPAETHQKSFDIITRQVKRIGEIIAKLRKFSQTKEDAIPEQVPLIALFETLAKQEMLTSGLEFNFSHRAADKKLLVRGNSSYFSDAITYLLQTIRNLSPEPSVVDIQYELLFPFSQHPCIEIKIHFTAPDISNNIMEPFQAAVLHEKYSTLDLALMHTIFSNYGGKVVLETFNKDKKTLKLKFMVAGIEKENARRIRANG